MPLDSIRLISELFKSLVVHGTPGSREREYALRGCLVEAYEAFEGVTRWGAQGAPLIGLVPLEPFRIVSQSDELGSAQQSVLEVSSVKRRNVEH
jgi:hypothetical protein